MHKRNLRHIIIMEKKIKKENIYAEKAERLKSDKIKQCNGFTRVNKK